MPKQRPEQRDLSSLLDERTQRVFEQLFSDERGAERIPTIHPSVESETVPGTVNDPGTLTVPGTKSVPGTLTVPSRRRASLLSRKEDAMRLHVRKQYWMAPQNLFSLTGVMGDKEFIVYLYLFSRCLVSGQLRPQRIRRQEIAQALSITRIKTVQSILSDMIAKEMIWRGDDLTKSGTMIMPYYPHQILGEPLPRGPDGELTLVEFSESEDTITSHEESGNTPGTESVPGTLSVPQGGAVSAPSPGTLSVPPNKEVSKKELNNLSLTSSTLVDQFYRAIGQVKVSQNKRERGEREVEGLRQSGFTDEQIGIAIEYTARNPERISQLTRVHSFSIIPQLIGQALRWYEEHQVDREQTRATERTIAHEDRERKVEAQRRQEAVQRRTQMSEKDRSILRRQAEARIPDATKQIVDPQSAAYTKMIDAHELDILIERHNSDASRP